MSGMLGRLKKEGHKAVICKFRNRLSNRKTDEKTREKIVKILSEEVHRGFGPTLASEYLAKKHGIEIGREALRQIMLSASLWRGRNQKLEEMHQWRTRRSRRGELVQWDTSTHDWLEGRGEAIHLIHMIAKQTPTGRPETMIDDALKRTDFTVCQARFHRGEHAGRARFNR